MMGVPVFLVKLMMRPQLSASAKLGPEDVICIEFANRLRAWTLDERLTAIWSHPANEVGGGTKNAKIRYAIAKALGLIAGFPDFIFTWKGGAGFIEFKAPKGTMSDNQKDFRSWCELVGIPYVVARSADEGEAALREWGVLA